MTFREGACIFLTVAGIAALWVSFIIDARADRALQDARNILARAEKLIREAESHD